MPVNSFAWVRNGDIPENIRGSHTASILAPGTASKITTLIAVDGLNIYPAALLELMAGHFIDRDRSLTVTDVKHLLENAATYFDERGFVRPDMPWPEERDER
jgi:hypothetical protein